MCPEGLTVETLRGFKFQYIERLLREIIRSTAVLARTDIERGSFSWG